MFVRIFEDVRVYCGVYKRDQRADLSALIKRKVRKKKRAIVVVYHTRFASGK